MSMLGIRRRAVGLGSDRGKASIGTLIALLTVTGGGYLAVKFMPVRFAAYQFDDTVREQVVFAGARRRRMGDQEVLGNIIERAEELRLPINKRNIRIQRRSRTIRIQVAYKVPVHLLFNYTYEWTFVVDHEGPSF